MLLPQDDRIIVLFVMGVVDERDFPRPNEFADALKLGTVLPKLCPVGTPPRRARSWPNHSRNSVLGVISFIQSSRAAFVWLTSRGQRRSTKTRTPSSGSADSYARFNVALSAHRPP